MYTMQDNIPSLMEVYADQAFQVILGGEEIPANLNYSISMGLGQVAGVYIAMEAPLSEDFIAYNEQMLQNNFMMMEIPEPHPNTLISPKNIGILPISNLSYMKLTIPV